jgi:hypothetical protein
MALIPLLFIVTIIFVGGVSSVYAQTEINVTSSTPCFLNYTAGVDMWEECGFQDDYISSTLVGFEWVMGGNFSMVIVGVIVLMTYIKYHTVIYPIAIGIIFLPVAWFLFPEVFISVTIIMAGVGIATGIWWAYTRQTQT